ncbi:MAG: S-adenosylmethionine:tRNA ribosyltransferase-isomerase [Bacteroidales bacterium]|nr:S-adenosylmethionine:tRNA ribosyltransferase-isomerase [Bacteroidales bacterium]
MIPEIRIEDYNYPLTDERIAKYPLPQRDSSKLLRYRDGKVDEFVFREIPDLLPENSIMVFNETKVVPARLHFERSTGAHIEIFCLEPVSPPEYNTSFASTEKCSWKCVIGNVKRWKSDTIALCNPENDATVAEMGLCANLLGRDDRTGIVEFTWKNGMPFSQVLETGGSVPIPPYLNRETEQIDLERYQTVYASIRGSVAAPTAGLHFTDDVLSRIKARGIDRENVCLHVGAGTFLPVKSSLVAEHHMHREPFAVTLDFLKDIRNSGKQVIAVGTTSVRTLESIYYVGVSIIETGEPQEVVQWAPYEREYKYSTGDAIDAIIDYLEKNGLDELKTGTSIIIVPGFKFRIVDLLVTNFHQPESTLILLVSAFVGGDWRTIYDYALSHQFRFLSYGDSSLLYRRQ